MLDDNKTIDTLTCFFVMHDLLFKLLFNFYIPSKKVHILAE